MVRTHEILFIVSFTFCLFNGPLSAKVLEKQELNRDRSFNNIAEKILNTPSGSTTTAENSIRLSEKSSDIESNQSFLNVLATDKNMQLFVLIVMLSIIGAGLGIYMRDHDL